MRNLLIPVAVIAALASPSLALAATETTNGTVKAVDTQLMTITLDSGQVYHLPPTLKLAGNIKPGAKVRVTWDEMAGVNEASTVAIQN